MKSIFGRNIIFSLFGESHGKIMGITIHGLKAGIKIDEKNIELELDRRRPHTLGSSTRKENDSFEIVSGLFNGFSTGAPLTILVTNTEQLSSDYCEGVIRPSHSDYTAFMQSHGYNDYRGGGHFSGRLTVLLCIAGAICKQILSEHEIIISSTIKQVGTLITCKETETQIMKMINQLNHEQDSIGGTIEVIAHGVEVGVGEPFFDSLESVLAHLFFSIPAVKAVEFGLGKDFAIKKGHEVLDELVFQDDKVCFKTNNNGGINGGISNGEDIISTITFKPTPTISQEVETINLKTKENINYISKGRHDTCLVLRSGVICEACMAIGLLDLLISKHGYEWM